MNSCGNAYCHGGSCTCGVYYGQNNGTSAYSMYYNQYQNDENYSENMYSFVSSPSSSSSSVDCTLSLGTPSTRLSTNENHEKRVRESSSTTHERRSSSSYMSKCWNILQNKTNSSAHKSGRSSNNNIGNVNNADPPRRCANCDTTSTPLWRNGPRGPKSLCNACGIRYKKEEKRSSAAAAANGNGGGIGMESSTQYMINESSWVHHSQGQKMPCYTSAYANHEFRFIEDHDDRDSDNAISFWPYLASQHC